MIRVSPLILAKLLLLHLLHPDLTFRHYIQLVMVTSTHLHHYYTYPMEQNGRLTGEFCLEQGIQEIRVRMALKGGRAQLDLPDLLELLAWMVVVVL